uniref:AP-3 complex subunit beta n=2 Tax=Podarcis muralis TaxID=64176 RepID=A0A670JNT6_PODMU
MTTHYFSSFYRNEDLKQMLESSKDSAKLDAMKRIVGMIARGKNASELFPSVVKNVASKNIEIKKLVYVYLMRYAEEQQDLALLSISTFQRALKDPNQLIRASALRVLSSIRVPIIVPIMMLAIKEASTDLSPYVRKNAAHAIQKLYSLDPEQKELLIEVIEKLLKDKSTLVAGSVVMAFEEVCPDRIDLIHKNYRKLCNLLVDVEEWGQVVIIHMLTRYARMQFVSPWKEEGILEEYSEKNFYGSEEEQKEKNQEANKPYSMDPDHRLLIRNTKPLLQSRNAAVVMAIAQLYWHVAPKSEAGIVAKSLVRLLRSNREVQYIVLQNIATMSIQHKGMFVPYLKSFYVRSTDPTMIKTLKVWFYILYLPYFSPYRTHFFPSKNEGEMCVRPMGRMQAFAEAWRARGVGAHRPLSLSRLQEQMPTSPGREEPESRESPEREREAREREKERESEREREPEREKKERERKERKRKEEPGRGKPREKEEEREGERESPRERESRERASREKRRERSPEREEGARESAERERARREEPEERERERSAPSPSPPAPDPPLPSSLGGSSAMTTNGGGSSSSRARPGLPSPAAGAKARDNLLKLCQRRPAEQPSRPRQPGSPSPRGPPSSLAQPQRSRPGSVPAFVPTRTHELLHRMSGKGLAAHYHFSRQPCVYNDQMVSVQVTLANTTDQKIENIHLGEKKLPTGMKVHVFNPIESLEPGESMTVSVGIDFCDSTQAANFQLCTKDDQFSINIQPPVGELLLPVTMSEKDFKRERGRLTGMNETSTTVTVAPQNSTRLVILQKVVSVANLGVVPSGEDNIHRFAAKTVHSGSLLLVTVEMEEGSTAQLIINTEKTVIGSILLRELKPVLSQG